MPSKGLAGQGGLVILGEGFDISEVTPEFPLSPPMVSLCMRQV